MNLLKQLLNDKTSGSVELTLKLNEILKKKQTKKEITEILKEAEMNLSNFASVLNYISKIRKILLNDSLQELITYLNQFEGSILATNKRLFENSKKYLLRHNSFFTLSNSFTVLQVLTELNSQKKIKVYICESLPEREGEILTNKLKDNNVITVLIKDDQISNYIKKADAVILGVDKIFENGDILNKTGSLTLAEIANKFKKPVYVLGDKSKIAEKNEKNNKLNLFEVVPSNLITKIFTD